MADVNSSRHFCCGYLRMFLHRYLQSATLIIESYTGDIPLAASLKTYFKQHKKFGSKDRKLVADLCFCFYRIGAMKAGESIEERLLIAQFLCNGNSDFIQELKPQWAPYSAQPVQQKLSFLGVEQDTLFPFQHEVSTEIDKPFFQLSFLVQPDLFLRIRPGKIGVVTKKIEVASIPFLAEDDCIRLPNGSKVDELIEPDKDAVVQDRNSQQVLASLKEQNHLHIKNCWDCCAASGGKSILLHDYLPQIQLTVSDVRQSILHNLKARFKRAGIQHYQAFVADLSAPQFSIAAKFDLVICDAPCSGSGTWSRTPEQLCFFQQDKIADYARLQKTIVSNAVKGVTKGGWFLYITCSVFKRENEEVVDYIVQKTSLQLVDQRYHKGYTQKADTLFSALFLLKLD